MKKIFIICPVRNVSKKVSGEIRHYVGGLEACGAEVHWPQRDTNQDDPIGLNICTQNGEAIRAAEEIHVWYDPDSQGSVFDLGMAFASHLDKPKKFEIINDNDVQPTAHKSFVNVLLALVKASS